ncbi:hypothetical protein C4559_01330 [Candidatus Microgenomates bacterium]|nr:MAG: hypothetical protein C4559_01330 [Candidatus Microgenomates bacterium]
MQSHIEKTRIKFLLGEQKEFIDKVYEVSKYRTNQLAGLVNIHPRSFRDWRREKLTMTLFAAEFICKKFNLKLPEDRQVLINRWKKAKKEANRIGGIALFKKHGSPATPEGRSKGGIKAIANLRKKGIVPTVKFYKLPDFSKELAEYVGIMLGDGGITSGQCTITLNSEADCDYVPFVLKLGKKLFGQSSKSIKRKDSKAICLYYNGVSLVRFFISIGLKMGNKVKQQVDVPVWIKSSQDYSIACLRGLMDTDGGVFLHKYKVGGKEYSYKKISFTNRSIPLLNFVAKTLKELKFTPKIVDKVENKKVWLYNEKEVKQYLKIVGTHNSRLLKPF